MKATFDVIPHLEDLWRYGRVLTGNDADADDLVQESLVRALSLARSYDSSRPLLPWLIRIVRNTFFTGSSRVKADRQRLAALAETAVSTLPPSQEHCAELADVGRALARMPTDQAEILHLVGVLGFTYCEAADLLGVPVGTVMSRLSRARAALKHNMENIDGRASGRLKIVGGRNVR
jgi:RNA polymerase sigma-70 factor (ECF subfamily)